jgi:hypothetical protein
MGLDKMMSEWMWEQATEFAQKAQQKLLGQTNSLPPPFNNPLFYICFGLVVITLIRWLLNLITCGMWGRLEWFVCSLYYSLYYLVVICVCYMLFM